MAAKCRLVEGNLRLAVSVALTFRNMGLDLEDLIQVTVPPPPPSRCASQLCPPGGVGVQLRTPVRTRPGACHCAVLDTGNSRL